MTYSVTDPTTAAKPFAPPHKAAPCVLNSRATVNPSRPSLR
jgi:hypothetical protein